MALGGAAEVVDGLEATWSSVAAVCEGRSEDEWDMPTDCPGWSVRDQVAHLIGIESTILGRPTPETPGPLGDHVRNEVGEMNERWIDAHRDLPGAEVLERFRAVAAERLAALRAMSDEDFAADAMTPIGPGTYLSFMRTRVFDSWVHEQDIRRALGAPGHLTGPAAEHTLDTVQGAMPFVVAKRAGAPDGTTVEFSVDGPVTRTFAVGVEGGRGRLLDDVPAEPTTRIEADFETFMVVACGRRHPGPALAEGRMRLTGDEALGRTVVERCDFLI